MKLFSTKEQLNKKNFERWSEENNYITSFNSRTTSQRKKRKNLRMKRGK